MPAGGTCDGWTGHFTVPSQLGPFRRACRHVAVVALVLAGHLADPTIVNYLGWYQLAFRALRSSCETAARRPHLEENVGTQSHFNRKLYRQLCDGQSAYGRTQPNPK